MKVWLNNLKEGDIFYYVNTLLTSVLKCKHLGDANNIYFKMPRVKYQIIEGCDTDIKEALGVVHEFFVNQYVYTDYDSAKDELIKKLNKELNNCEYAIDKHKKDIKLLEDRILKIKNILINNG